MSHQARDIEQSTNVVPQDEPSQVVAGVVVDANAAVGNVADANATAGNVAANAAAATSGAAETPPQNVVPFLTTPLGQMLLQRGPITTEKMNKLWAVHQRLVTTPHTYLPTNIDEMMEEKYRSLDDINNKMDIALQKWQDDMNEEANAWAEFRIMYEDDELDDLYKKYAAERAALLGQKVHCSKGIVEALEHGVKAIKMAIQDSEKVIRKAQEYMEFDYQLEMACTFLEQEDAPHHNRDAAAAEDATMEQDGPDHLIHHR